MKRSFCLSSRETTHLSNNLWQPSSRVYFEKRKNYQRELKSTKQKINFTQESLFFLIFSEKVRIDISSFRFYTFFALKIKQTLSILLPGQRTELSPRYHVLDNNPLLLLFFIPRRRRERSANAGAGAAASRHRSETRRKWPLPGIAQRDRDHKCDLSPASRASLDKPRRVHGSIDHTRGRILLELESNAV